MCDWRGTRHAGGTGPRQEIRKFRNRFFCSGPEETAAAWTIRATQLEKRQFGQKFRRKVTIGNEWAGAASDVTG